MVHVGFSGTRHGLTGEQSRALGLSLASLGDAVLHHGDAVGADAEAHEQAVALGWSVIIHPPINDAWRARKAASEERAPKPYLVRNRDIVDETELLVAAPADAVDLAAHRARTIMKGSAPVVDPDYDKNSVIALREIAEKVVTPNDMRERLIHSMQENVEIDESETTAAPRLPEISRPRLGRDDPSIDRKMDTMTEDALLRQRCEGFLPSSRRRVARSKRQ